MACLVEEVAVYPVRFTSDEKKALLCRFLRYVKINTQSDENSTASPSTECQKDLARLLVTELIELGCKDARMDEWGYVYGTIAANLEGPSASRVPAIGLLAHLDTYFGTKGDNVRPQVIEHYEGGDLRLPGDPTQVLRPETEANLGRCKGHTIITSDGTTLLGADDKAGIAEIMSVVAYLQAHPEFKHGRICIAFTPDEEVGRGTEHFDRAAFGADFAYTLDGSDLGEVEDETFCADSALVTIEGLDVHPGYAKGKMVSAVRAASALVSHLPEAHLPETTEGRESYLHPYDIRGDVTKVEVKFLVRAFEVEGIKARENDLTRLLEWLGRQFSGVKVTVTFKEQYRNMKYKLDEDPRVVEYAFEAIQRQGLEPARKAIRGGTDGARLSYMGLLTPNIWAGGQSFHSVREWVSLEWMAAAAETTVALLGVWVEKALG